MIVYEFFQWMNGSTLGEAIRGSTWWWPTLEAVHTLGTVAVVGSISLVDLRLLGVTLRREPVSEVASRLLPVLWMSFALQAVTGILLVFSEAERLYSIPYFWIKMGFLAVAGLNALLFHFTIYRSVGKWDHDVITPRRARMTGVISLAMWIGVVAAGRAIGYVE